MRNYITASSLVFLTILSACSAEPKKDPEPKKDSSAGRSLLLPEHQDTTTVYRPRPDSIFANLSYQNTEQWNGTNFFHITFDHLADVTIDESQFEESVGAYIKIIHFSKNVKKLDGKKVMIKGYLLPISHTEQFYFLSAFPYTQCYFCNQAGLESVIELDLSEDIPGSIKMDQIVMVVGTLELSSADLYKLPYTLHNARIMKYY